ncbi:MAG: phage holin [Oscillospiraceae bacterium]|nr:phage holin [Oscillospiraceae bacterium]
MKIKKSTIIRTIILIITLVNLILNAIDKSPLPISNDTVNDIVSSIAAVISSLTAWWYNNSFTKPALAADEVMEQLKGADDDA